jgi:hypothetical protein
VSMSSPGVIGRMREERGTGVRESSVPPPGPNSDEDQRVGKKKNHRIVMNQTMTVVMVMNLKWNKQSPRSNSHNSCITFEDLDQVLLKFC